VIQVERKENFGENPRSGGRGDEIELETSFRASVAKKKPATKTSPGEDKEFSG